MIKQSSIELVNKVAEICCIADDFCKEYELELNKKALLLSNPSPPKGRVAVVQRSPDWERQRLWRRF